MLKLAVHWIGHTHTDLRWLQLVPFVLKFSCFRGKSEIMVSWWSHTAVTTSVLLDFVYDSIASTSSCLHFIQKKICDILKITIIIYPPPHRKIKIKSVNNDALSNLIFIYSFFPFFSLNIYNKAFIEQFDNWITKPMF